MFEVWPMVFDQEYYAAPHEPRVWCGEEDSVHDLPEAFPQEMESGAAHKAIASCMIRRQCGCGVGKDVPKFAGGLKIFE